MKKELICIVCPNGCELTVEVHDGELKIQGASCHRGYEYAKREITNPMRTIATSVLIENGEFPLASVRLNRPVPIARIFDIMKEINHIRLKAPVHIGDVVIKDVCGCGSDIIATKNVECVNG